MNHLVLNTECRVPKFDLSVGVSFVDTIRARNSRKREVKERELQKFVREKRVRCRPIDRPKSGSIVLLVPIPFENLTRFKLWCIFHFNYT